MRGRACGLVPIREKDETGSHLVFSQVVVHKYTGTKDIKLGNNSKVIDIKTTNININYNIIRKYLIFTLFFLILISIMILIINEILK
ncbi:hypothetical protein Metev_1576 [Methanohalobium evestigatum Z-7303]|uniref:Uncharacterized protein n=1 Tax=Methanohalobium evestigatum (strain ATCC BAA-1072 / DSM 3721 / NBRC 107634 / OCM 161 / Z-7303) TaxID=644295 RepID=D7EA00_METEZ|nr:hypothetical protein Metev_1576 [Methanohalobium evestigatum Z-7303]